jgi:hypothetical protein
MRIALILFFALIGGCSFFDRLGNKPYIFPTSDEPYSEIIVTYDNGSLFKIFNMDVNGCFAGTSIIGPAGKSIKIHSNTETFMALDMSSSSSFCQVIFSFTPEQDFKYEFTQGTHIEDRSGISGFLSGPDIYCSVSGQKILKTGKKEPLEFKQMNLRPSGLACLRMRETSKSK